MSNQNILGWDVGGAHLKAAMLSDDGQITQVIQVPCALWRGLDQLQLAIQQVLACLQEEATQHAVTMTGELVDLFPNRHTGVCQITDLLSQELPGKVAFYKGGGEFLAIADVAYQTPAIASANWLASAEWIAGKLPEGLLVDIGSTTADLIVLKDGEPQPRGFNDAERMQYEELVYTGVIRTPLMAIAPKIPFSGEYVNVAAEYFATSADVYRVTGDLTEAEDMADTSDGGPKTREASMRRLARMIGRDVESADQSAWLQLAYAFKAEQLKRLSDASLRAYSRNILSHGAPVIGAGAGRFLAHRLATSLGRPYIDVSSLLTVGDQELASWVNVCLPACAVAAILSEQ